MKKSFAITAMATMVSVTTMPMSRGRYAPNGWTAVACASSTSFHHVDVIFGWPADRPVPHLEAIRGRIETSAATADDHLYRSGGAQHLRWRCDMFGRLDIRFEELPPVGDDGELTFNEIVLRLQSRGYRDDQSLYLVFVEPHQGYSGVGEATMPAIPPEGPQYALVADWIGRWVLHEIGHMLGAVPAAAPHQFQNGHCSEQRDVMCRDPEENSALVESGLFRLSCPDNPDWYFDCNHDDYYLHDGEWWDVADSPFLFRPTTAALPPDSRVERRRKMGLPAIMTSR